MENEVYITRKQQWFDTTAGKDIPLEEWVAFVKNDPEMRLDNFVQVKMANAEIFRYDNPGAAVYLHRNCGEMQVCEIPFEYISGNILVKEPGEEAMEKIRHIAFKLGAHVQAESGAQTEEVALQHPAEPKPVFTFSDLLNPVKKIMHRLEPGTGDNTLNHVPEPGEKK